MVRAEVTMKDLIRCIADNLLCAVFQTIKYSLQSRKALANRFHAQIEW